MFLTCMCAYVANTLLSDSFKTVKYPCWYQPENPPLFCGILFDICLIVIQQAFNFCLLKMMRWLSRIRLTTCLFPFSPNPHKTWFIFSLTTFQHSHTFFYFLVTALFLLSPHIFSRTGCFLSVLIDKHTATRKDKMPSITDTGLTISVFYTRDTRTLCVIIPFTSVHVTL